MAGVYIHIPFCKRACAYCDFHFSTNLKHKNALVTAIIKELDLRHTYLSDKNIDSIYFGGGTPSLLSVNELESIFERLSSYFSWNKSTEITLEANPDDITEEALSDWKKTGINRLSIGLQSFNDEELTWFNRAHTAKQSLASVSMAQDKGFDNITIDLIYGSKFQTLSSWEKTLQQAIDLNTQHISAYNLTIENKTALGVNYAKGKEPAVNEDLSSRQFLMLIQHLQRAEFVQYEISNFGKPNFFAKHNSNYWLQKNYLGLGASAHSFNGVSRQWNVKNNALYIKALNHNSTFFEREELLLQDRYNEYVLTRLRTIWGCDVKEIEKLFGKNLRDYFEKKAVNKQHDIKEYKGIFTLTELGKLRADGIAADLFI
ncbi:MAG: radical SAM family heme chaperone HemW [Bacteroidetes bacterium]|nr:radical SAM family heme chaperone HemW [Bacteroidota bacterium]